MFDIFIYIFTKLLLIVDEININQSFFSLESSFTQSVTAEWCIQTAFNFDIGIRMLVTGFSLEISIICEDVLGIHHTVQCFKWISINIWMCWVNMKYEIWYMKCDASNEYQICCQMSRPNYQSLLAINIQIFTTKLAAWLS